MQTTGNLGLKKPEGTDIVDIADLNGNMDILDTTVNNKVDKVTGKQLSTNDYTTAEKTKLAGIAAGANNYTHPSTHPPAIIAQDASNRFVTDTEKSAWNEKASTAVATHSASGLMTAPDKTKLDNIAAGANNYVHPATHSPSIIAQDQNSQFVTAADKTNWNAKANLSTTPQKTTADITYYVRTDGNDNNTGLANTAAGAFKTIMKAIKMIPQVLNHDVIVNVFAGTYAEDVTIEGLYGSGYLGIVGTSVTVQSVAVIRCQRVQITGITATSTTKPTLQAYDGGMIDFVSCRVTTSSANATGVSITNQKGIISGCTISNRGTAIEANNAEVAVVNCDGTGNTNAILPNNSAVVTTGGSLPSGGILGNFRGVVNPWGDNTRDLRSRAEAGPSGTQSIVANTFTKVNYGVEYEDVLGEYTPATARFTAKTLGTYLISVQVGLVGGVTSPVRGILEIWVNGGAGKVRITDFTTGGGTDFSATGSAAVGLGPGDYAEIYLLATTAKDVSTSTSGTFIRIIRVA